MDGLFYEYTQEIDIVPHSDTSFSSVCFSIQRTFETSLNQDTGNDSSLFTPPPKLNQAKEEKEVASDQLLNI